MIPELLHKHGLSAKEALGQHFIEDEELLRREVEEAEIDADDHVLEIGPGLGTLTRLLAEAAGQVTAIEQDSTLIPVLEKELRMYDNVELIHGDAMDVDWPEVDHCVCNPPYQIASALLERLGEAGIPSVMIVQEEFAQRLIAEPGSSEYSRLTLMANYYFVPVHLRSVPAESFEPEPEVESALIKLFPADKDEEIAPELFFTTVDALFTHKRKKVRNAFVDSRHITGMTKDRAKELRDELPHSEERVINLDLQQVVEIASFLEPHLGDTR